MARSMSPGSVQENPPSKYAHKYHAEWERGSMRVWLRPVEGNPWMAQCIVCPHKMQTHHNNIVRHGDSIKHSNNMAKYRQSLAGISRETSPERSAASSRHRPHPAASASDWSLQQEVLPRPGQQGNETTTAAACTAPASTAAAAYTAPTSTAAAIHPFGEMAEQDCRRLDRFRANVDIGYERPLFRSTPKVASSLCPAAANKVSTNITSADAFPRCSAASSRHPPGLAASASHWSLQEELFPPSPVPAPPFRAPRQQIRRELSTETRLQVLEERLEALIRSHQRLENQLKSLLRKDDVMALP